MIDLQQARPITGFDFEPFEYEFYQASVQAEQAERRRRRRILLSIVAALALVAVLVALTIIAFASQQSALEQRSTAEAASTLAVEQRQTAEVASTAAVEQQMMADQARNTAQLQEQRARARELVSYATNAFSLGYPQRALLLALQGIQVYQHSGENRMAAGEQALRDILGGLNGAPARCPMQDPGPALASPDGRWLLVSGYQGQACLLEIKNGTDMPQPAAPRVLDVPPLEAQFSPDSRWLLFAGQPASLLYSMDALDQAPLRLAAVSGPAVFNHDGNILAIVDAGGSTRLYGFQDGELKGSVKVNDYAPRFLNIDEGNHWLLATVVSGQEQSLYLYDLSPVFWASSEDQAEAALRESEVLVTSGVSASALSPNGRWLAAIRASVTENTLEVWNLDRPIKNQKPQVALGTINRAKEVEYSSLIFSRDSVWLLASPEIYENYLFYVAEGFKSDMEPLSMESNGETIHNPVLSPDGCWLLGTTSEGLFLWLLEKADYYQKGDPRDTWPYGEVQGRYADGRTMLSSRPPIFLGSISTDDRSLVFSTPDLEYHLSRYLATPGTANEVRLWDLSSIREPGGGCWVSPNNIRLQYTSLTGLERSPLYLFFGEADTWLTAYDPGTIWLWGLEPPDRPASPQDLKMKMSKAPLIGLDTSPDGHWVAMGNSTEIRLWPAEDLQGEGHSLSPPENLFMDLTKFAFSPDGSWLAAGTDSSEVLLWNTKDLSTPPRLFSLSNLSMINVQPQFQTFSQYGIQQILFSADGRWLAALNSSGWLVLWPLNTDLESPEPVVLSEHISLDTYDPVSIDTVVMDPLGRWVAAVEEPAPRKSQMVFWDLKSDAHVELARFDLPGFRYQVAVLPSGDGLVTLREDYLTLAGERGTPLLLWDLRDLGSGKTPAYTVLDIPGSVPKFTLSPSGRWLAAVLSGDDVYSLWDLAAVQAAGVQTADAESFAVSLYTPTGKFGWARFSPNDRWLAVGGLDRNARLWRLDALDQGSIVLGGYGDTVNRLSFTQEALVAADSSGEVRAWPLEQDALIKMACTLIDRELTVVEQLQYLQGEQPLPVCSP